MILVGRGREQAELDALIASAREGMSGALVVRGEAGIGKTALLDYAAVAAEDLHVIRIDGVESELELPHAALHRMLLPFLDRIDVLAAPQRHALQSAFGVEPEIPSAFLVGLATLSLLAEAASAGPLVCLVDDAQWVDPPSIEALAFVARRLVADGIALIFAVRDEARPLIPLESLPELVLDGLDRASAQQLPAVVALEAGLADRLLNEAGGNPLALTELAGELDGVLESSLPNVLPLTPRLEARFLRQSRTLPAETQTFLLLAAAEPACDVETLFRAAEQLGLGFDASAPAQAEGLLRFTDRATFRHPLIRSAVYGASLEADRRRVHAALGAAFTVEQTPDLRAWHRGAAAVAPDDEIARELEQSADRAHARAGHAAECAFLERAAALTSAPEERARRLIGAARAAHGSADPVRAQRLLEQASSFPGTALLRAQASFVFALTLPGAGRLREAPQALACAARALEPLDPRLARDAWLEALTFGLMAREQMTGISLRKLALAGLGAPVSDPPTFEDVLFTAVATRIVDPKATTKPSLRDAVEAMRDRPEVESARAHVGFFASLATQDLWDDESRRTILERLQRVEQRLGPSRRRVVLIGLAHGAYLTGDPDAADAHLHRAFEIAVAVSGPFRGHQAMDVEWLAWQGADAETRSAAEALDTVARIGGHGALHHFAQRALTLLEIGHGRYSEALAHARPIYEQDPFPFGSQVLPELVEAAARTGERALATAAQHRLAERAVVSGTPWALSLAARCAALLADDDEAEALYRASLAHLATSRIKTDLARTQLLFGEWLRRQRRRTEAREQLRAAHEQFTAMRCLAFAERARAELAATGERARTRTPEARDDLTPRETQIARLAARRATNAEIAAELFISESTVAYHLRKIFRKLDIGSRRELQATLASTANTFGLARTQDGR